MNTFGPPKLALVRGEGTHVWDADGKEYVDLLAGIAVNSLGHGHPALVGAITEQLQTLGHVSNFFTTGPQVELAEALLRLLDGGVAAQGGGKVFFTNSGAEANEGA
ncbi:MAG: acetylornithine aminotransferase, partial [Nocardioides sp.]|nr:acetylornithine aminotransferase [Nocardioides sp.]